MLELFLGQLAAVVIAGIGLEQVRSDAALLGDGSSTVVVATVVATADGTNGSPPSISLRVEEVLAGSAETGTTVQAWRPRGHHIDYIGGDSQQRLQEWQARALRGPAKNSRWILLLKHGVSPRCRYPYSDEKRSWVVKTIAGNRVRATARAAREKALADEAAAAEERRIASADLSSLWRRSADVVVGRCGSTMSDPDGKRVTVTVEKRLRGARATGKKRQLIFRKNEALPPLCWRRERVVLFLRRDKFRLSNGYQGDGWFLTDATTGVLPARPAILSRLKKLAAGSR